LDVRAAVAHRAGAPLTIETVQLDGPKTGEALIEIKDAKRLRTSLA
jgi:S-(hydroxymethyl)glutathione dehydrogenase / alcohol dehydrogenase